VSYEFLTDDHLSRYGRYLGDPTPEQLAALFYLRPADLDLVAERRHTHTKLGFAAQLVTLHFLGTFLLDPCDVPSVVLHRLAAQLRICRLRSSSVSTTATAAATAAATVPTAVATSSHHTVTPTLPP